MTEYESCISKCKKHKSSRSMINLALYNQKMKSYEFKPILKVTLTALAQIMTTIKFFPFCIIFICFVSNKKLILQGHPYSLCWLFFIFSLNDSP